MRSPSCSAPSSPERVDVRWRSRPGASARVWPAEAMVRLVCRATNGPQRSGMAAIDVGCGNGRNSIALAALGFGSVIAIDPIRPLLDDALRNARQRAVSIETRLGGFPHLPCDADTVDLAVCWGVLFVLGGEGPTRTALGELARVLRPGGLLVADWRTEADGLRSFAETAVGKDTHRLGSSAPVNLGGTVYSFWDAEQVRAMHADAGFEVVAMHRAETMDLMEDSTYSWWQTCAIRSES